MYCSTTDKVSHRQHTEDLEVLERKLSKRIDDKVLSKTVTFYYRDVFVCMCVCFIFLE